MSKKYVYLFSEGNASMKNLLGGKGANLAEMTGLGLPVPQGFTVTTEACTRYYEDGKVVADDIVAQIFEAMGKKEAITGKKFGDPSNRCWFPCARARPLRREVDTILNLGLNDVAVTPEAS